MGEENVLSKAHKGCYIQFMGVFFFILLQCERVSNRAICMLPEFALYIRGRYVSLWELEI